MSPDDSNEGNLTPRPLDEIYDQDESTAALMPPLLPDLSFKSIWDSDMIEKFYDPSGRKKWRCMHCNESWFEYNATKALSHVVGTGRDIGACKGSIANKYRQAYNELYVSKNGSRELKQQFQAKIQQDWDSTDGRTLAYYSEGKSAGKRSISSVEIDLTLPITNSVATASTSKSLSSKKTSIHFKPH